MTGEGSFKGKSTVFRYIALYLTMIRSPEKI